MRYDWLDEKKSEIIDRYVNNDESLASIANEYDVAPNTIRNRLKEWDIETTHRYRWLDERTDEIVHRYVENEESLQTIADDFGTSTDPIKKRLEEAAVPLRPYNCSFSEQQISIVQGELLGDGCIYKRHETAYHFKLENTVRAHPTYVCDQLPHGIFPNSQPYSLFRSTDFGDNIRWIIYSRGQALFGDLHDDWYEHDGESWRKTVPADFELDETALLHWHFGDGTLSKRGEDQYRISLSTQGFSETAVQRLQTQLERIGYDNYTTLRRSVDNGSGLAICLTAAASQTFIEQFAPQNPLGAYDYKFRQ